MFGSVFGKQNVGYLKKNWPDPQVEDLSCKTSTIQRRAVSLISAVFGCVRRNVFGEHVFDCVPVFELCSCVRIVFVTVSMKCSGSVFGRRTRLCSSLS